MSSYAKQPLWSTPRLAIVMKHSPSIPSAAIRGLLVCSLATACAASQESSPQTIHVFPSVGSEGLFGPHDLFWMPGFWVQLYYVPKGTGMTLRKEESELDLSDPFHPTLVAHHESERAFSLSFAIQFITSRHANEWYLAGTAPNGDTVIERWTLPPEVGGYCTSRPVADTPIGTAAPPSVLLVDLWNGSERKRGLLDLLDYSFIAPAARSQPLPPIREEIYRGTELAYVHCMAVDPEGRFLLIRDKGSSVLHRLVLDDPASLAVLYTADEIPALSTSILSVAVQHHAREGRIYILAALDGDPVGTVVLLKDTDNDGLFDIAPMTYDAYVASGYAEPDAWSENFVDYELAAFSTR